MNKTSKKHASTPKYVSPNQLVLDGFSTPFDKALNPENRWVGNYADIGIIYIMPHPL